MQDWRHHCMEYNACGHRVYFVQNNWYSNVYAPRYHQNTADQAATIGMIIGTTVAATTVRIAATAITAAIMVTTVTIGITATTDRIPRTAKEAAQAAMA